MGAALGSWLPAPPGSERAVRRLGLQQLQRMRSVVAVLGLSPEALVIRRRIRGSHQGPPALAELVLNPWTGEALTQFYERLSEEMIMILRPEREIAEAPSYPGREVGMYGSPEVL